MASHDNQNISKPAPKPVQQLAAYFHIPGLTLYGHGDQGIFVKFDDLNQVFFIHEEDMLAFFLQALKPRTH